MPKGKAVRRALCYYQENIVIIESVDRESMHDFTQDLLDMGVQEAIDIVCLIQLPLYENENGDRIVNENIYEEGIQEAYIVWRK